MVDRAERTAYAIEQSILTCVHDIAIHEFLHPFTGFLVRTEREIGQAKSQPAQQFFGKGIREATRAQAALQVHYTALSHSTRKRPKVSRQGIPMYDDERRESCSFSHALNEAKTVT